MDVRAFRALVYSLGVAAVLSVGGIVVADTLGHEIPETLKHAASTTIGTLIGLLINPPRSRNGDVGGSGADGASPDPVVVKVAAGS